MTVMKPEAFHALPITAKLSILPSGVAIQKQDTVWEVAHPRFRAISATAKTLNQCLTIWWSIYHNRQDKFKGCKQSKARLS
jgi:hypothetical protein